MLLKATYTPVLELFNNVLAHLDVILRYACRLSLIPRPTDGHDSMAHVAVNAPEAYVKPNVLEKGNRHRDPVTRI
jgi:DNA mismatch repair protein MSH2